jgi:metal-sulfur cluster biosynthetic enzyme
VQRKVLDKVDELSDSQVEITWDPPWTVDRMSEAAKLQLGMM